MKYIFLLVVTMLLAACGKLANPNPVQSKSTSLSGKYAAYILIDTLFLKNNMANGVESITDETLTGDTAYFNPGTVNFKIVPNAILNYSPNRMIDTLNFTSPSKGIESNAATSYQFTYSLSTGTINSQVTTRLVVINSSIIESISPEVVDNVIGDVTAIYYKKL